MVRRLTLAVALALVAAACSVPDLGGDDAAPDAGEELLNADGYPLIEPDPDATPHPIDDDVRIGTLPNGLTYYVRSNDSPGFGLSLRLVVNAGSLQQEVPESGAAHFLEHMLFNGTEQFPGNELDLALQTIGVEIGPDLNAYTSFDETVYELELANITDETVDIGFSVLSQWASAATITEVDTEDEKGVVREEIRLSDEGSAGAVNDAFDAAYLGGSAYDGREPGGRDDLILATTADDLRFFYDRWYRPELMAVVAVGDLPIDRLEDEVIDRFSDLEGRGPASERVEPDVALIDEPLVQVLTHPDLSDTFGSLDYSIPDWDTGTAGGERLWYLQLLYGEMIRARLLDASDRGENTLIEPWAGVFDYTRNQRFLGFNYDAPDLAEGTAAVLAELRRVELVGFDEDELARAIEAVRVEVDGYAAGADNVNDRFWADDYVAHFLEGVDISDPDDYAVRVNAILDDVTAAEVTDLFRYERSLSAPILIVAGPDAAELPTEAVLEEVMQRAAKPRPRTEAVDDGEIPEQLMDRPDPVDFAAVNPLDELDATEWVFDNGARVRFTESDIAPNDLTLLAFADGGWSSLDPADAAIADLAVDAVAASGIGSLDRVATRRFLASRDTALGPFVSETIDGFSGNSSTDDLEILFQQLHLAYTAPRSEAAGLAEAKERSEEVRSIVLTNANVAADDAVRTALYGDDPRFSLDSPPIDDLTTDEALRIYRERFGGVDDLVIAIAGDADPDVVADLAARYVGTLPAGPADTWSDVRPVVTLPTEVIEVPIGGPEEAAAIRVVHHTPTGLDATTEVELRVLETLINARLFQRIREELGATYGGFIALTPSYAPFEEVRAEFEAEVDPERAVEVLDVVVADLDDLATNGPSADELSRSLALVQSDYELISNGEFIDMLLTPDDELPLTYDRRLDLLDEVTGDSLQALAAQVFDPTYRVRLVTVPE
ncbi:MAG: insulinase family protein [Actinomycetota bacterium]